MAQLPKGYVTFADFKGKRSARLAIGWTVDEIKTRAKTQLRMDLSNALLAPKQKKTRIPLPAPLVLINYFLREPEKTKKPPGGSRGVLFFPT